ncbi:MAG TPA: M20/M25/M40 family metallo-hydrolase [Thermoanaerobaculia bacterium]|nr:M20/M25/M40 family metallo-hydrolase [Thermoanaerobaculia bacterium]
MKRFALFLALALPARAEQPVDLAVVTKIRDEGLNRGKVIETLSAMCDGIGPRLTGSPSMKTASAWAREKLSEWGLANVHSESYAPLLRSWTWQKSSLEVVAPYHAQVQAIPKAWTPGTNGVVKGAPVFAPIEAIWKETTDVDKWIAEWKGKLAGKIVLVSPKPDLKPPLKPDAKRETKESLEELSRFEQGGGEREPPREKLLKYLERVEKLRKALEDEKPAGLIYASSVGDGTIRVDGTYQHRKSDPLYPPSVVVTAESYGRIARLAARKVPVELALDVATTLGDDDPDAEVNTLAEIPGIDPKKKDEVVMLGAHFDSWHGGTGATDNGAGAAVVMEAMRILKVVGVSPRRTIRVALWSGEEQGLYGSWAYVTKHFADRPLSTEPRELLLSPFERKATGPVSVKPQHAKLAAYFNLDNGAGRIRGIYCQENAPMRPIFEAWLEPLRDLGADTVTLRNTGGTDHLSFDAFGLPGFQFIQDELDYSSRTHHTNMDTVERAPRADLMQAAVVLASFVYDAAMRDEKLPRKAMPAWPPRDEEKNEEKDAAAKP